MKNKIPHLLILMFAFLFNAKNVSSQSFRPPLVHDYIHANNIKAAVGQYSTNFWDYNGAKFLVPYQGPESPSTIFASALWITGEDQNGNAYFSYENYANNLQFLPGPLPEDETPLSQSEILNWNKIFKVSGTDILAHIEDAKDGTIDRPLESIFGWPAAGNIHFEGIHGFAAEFGPEGGAYFIEVPGSANGIYEPELGEYPHIETLPIDVIPGEMTWAVYNNADQQKLWNNGDRTMTVEIQQSSYSFNCPGSFLYENVFHDYKVISRTDENLTSLKFGLWMDPDLGCYYDDYIGCDPGINTFYTYNEDDQDDNCATGVNTPNYGNNPPVQTVTFLNNDLDGFVIYHNPGVTPTPEPATVEPVNGEEVLNYMNGLWRDGTPLTRGGNGFNPSSGDTIRFLFPDNPNDPNGWSMYQEDLPPSDRRSIAIVESSLSPGTSRIFTLAFGYHNHPDSNFLSNINFALDRVDSLQQLYDMGELGCQTELCTCECVWPGDANSDGRVSYLDAVNIIQAIDDNGATRPNPYPFTPEQVDDWSLSSFMGINSKFADTDGNGEVNIRDLDLLSEYIGRSNYCIEELPEKCMEGEEVYFEIQNWGTDFPTRIGIGQIKVKNLNDFWGISFKIKYDTEIFRFINGPSARDWKDPDLEVIEFYNEQVDHMFGEQQLVFFNDAGMDAEPQNNQDVSIADFIMAPGNLPTQYPEKYATLKICDFTVYYEDGTSELLPSETAKYMLPDSVVITSTSQFEDRFEKVTVYPNPGSGQFNINASFPVDRVEIFNTQGQLVQTTQGNQIQIQSDLKGIYIFKIFGAEGKLGFSKVILQ